MKILFKKITNTHSFYLLLTVLSTIAIFWRPLFTRGLLLYADSTSPVLNLDGFNKIANYLYVEKYFNVIKNPIYTTLYFILQKIYYFVGLIANEEQLSVLWILFPVLFLNITVYALFSLFINNKKIIFLQTIIFIFSFFIFNQIFAGLDTTIWSMAGSLAMFVLVIKYFEEPRFKYIIFAAIASLFGVMNIAFFYCAVLAAVLYGIIFCLLKKLPLRELIRRYFPLVGLLLLGLLLHAFWLFPYLSAYSHNQINFGGTSDFTFLRDMSYVGPLNNFRFGYIFQDFPLYKPVFSWYNSFWYSLLTVVFLLIIFYWALIKNRKNRFTLGLVVLYFLLFSFTLGTGFILWNLFSYIPGWFLLRNLTRFYYLMWFILVLLVGQILVKEIKKFWLYFFIGFAIINTIVFFHSDLFKFFTNSVLPKDYGKIVQYLSTTKRQNQGVVVLPEFPWAPRFTWIKNKFYNAPLFNNLLVNPTVFSYWGRGMVPEYFYSFLDDKIDKNGIAVYLGQSGIKYIIVHHDIRDTSSPVFLKNVETAENISKIIDGPAVKLYEIDNDLYIPVIYADRPIIYQKINPGKYLIKLKIDQPVKLVFNQPFNSDIKLFPQKINDSDCPLINDFQNVQAKECEPQNIFFQLDDLTHLWSQAVFSDSQTKINDYANQWTIDPEYIKQHFSKDDYKENPDGSIDLELILYFKPQSYFYLGLLVSGTALLGCLGYLGYDLVKRRKRKGVCS